MFRDARGPASLWQGKAAAHSIGVITKSESSLPEDPSPEICCRKRTTWHGALHATADGLFNQLVAKNGITPGTRYHLTTEGAGAVPRAEFVS
ncbi:hypothetical protein J6590_028823 [Homalodisca vitripennis]|nr:hypothetical protein J6590_028823 [Homalodisca vitripennis]